MKATAKLLATALLSSAALVATEVQAQADAGKHRSGGAHRGDGGHRWNGNRDGGHRWNGNRGGGHRWNGNWRGHRYWSPSWGFYFGVPLYWGATWGWPYYPDYYYYDYPRETVIYRDVERMPEQFPEGEISPAPSTQVPRGEGAPTRGPLYMNYCESAKAYFPKVTTCPEGWRLATPAS